MVSATHLESLTPSAHYKTPLSCRRCAAPPASCGQPPDPGLAPHLIVYFTMDKALVEEVVHAVKCFSHSLIEGTSWAGEQFNSSFCDNIRWDAGRYCFCFALLAST